MTWGNAHFLWKNIFPTTCAFCLKRTSDSTNKICIECMGLLPKTHFHQLQDSPIKNKFNGIMQVERASSFLYYKKNNLTSKILYQIKYDNQSELCVELGAIYGQELKNTWVEDCDMLIPLPLHPSKKALRGYNQSEKIALGLSQTLNIPMNPNLLIRTKASVSQTTLSRAERLKNVANVFELKNPEALKGLHVVLIDDVITTGATLDMAGSELLKSPLKSLNILTLATAFDL